MSRHGFPVSTNSTRIDSAVRLAAPQPNSRNLHRFFTTTPYSVFVQRRRRTATQGELK
jgi:hypothetical protein